MIERLSFITHTMYGIGFEQEFWFFNYLGKTSLAFTLIFGGSTHVFFHRNYVLRKNLKELLSAEKTFVNISYFENVERN